MISLGLRLHHHQLRYALVSHSKGKWRCLETGTAENSKLILKRLARKAHRIILGLSASQVLTKTIATPASLKYSDVTNYIRDQLPLWFGLHHKKLQFDFFPLKALDDKKRWQVIATRKSIIQQYQQALFNIKLDAIDVDMFALMRLAKIRIKQNSYIWVFDNGIEVLIFSVNNGEQQRSIVLKKLLPQHIEQFRQHNEPIFLSGRIDEYPQISAEIIHQSEYFDCIGLALWNMN